MILEKDLNSEDNLKSKESFNLEEETGSETKFFPNNNTLAFFKNNNLKVELTEGYSNNSERYKAEEVKIGQFNTDGTSFFKMKFSNNSFPEIMNYYQNLVLTSIWDVREYGDYENIILGRSHMFYKVHNFNWNRYSTFEDKNREYFEQNGFFDYEHTDEISKTSNEKINSDKNTLNPIELYEKVLNFSKEKGLVNFDIGVSTGKENEEEKNIVENLKRNLYRDGVRKISENHFAISKINLISHDIQINETVNAVSIAYENDGNEDDNNKVLLGIINSNKKEDIVEKPIKSIFGENEKLKGDNILIQCDYMATQLIKELELAYQGTITILFNNDIQINDTITLIDETSSTQGVFKIMSFEHILDQRGLITILKVCAYWEFRDPILDTFSNSISYTLMDNFREKIANNLDASDSYVINKIFGFYMKYITHSIKYTNLRFINLNEEGEIIFQGEIENEKKVQRFLPSIIPLRFYPMLKKGIYKVPKNLEKSFYYQNIIYRGLFEWISKTFNLKIPKFFNNFGQSAKKVLVFLADTIFSTLTFNLHELVKPALGESERKADEAIVGKIIIDKDEFKESNKYSPYMPNNSFDNGRKFDFSIAFFNVQLQNITNLNSNYRTTEVDAEKAIKVKEEVINQYITNKFDHTLMVEIYDGFNKEKTIKNYDFLTFTNNIKPINGIRNNAGELFHNQHGSEYGFTFSKDKLIQSEIINSGVIEKINYYNESGEKGNIKIESKERNFVKSMVDISELGLDISKIYIFWFHNLYGETDKDIDDIKVRKQFVKSVFDKMNETLNKEKNVGVIMMGDCNLEIINYGRNNYTITGDSAMNNYIYSIPEIYKDTFKSIMNEATTLNMKKQGKNIFDNIVVSKNMLSDEMEEYFYWGVYNYPYVEKRKVSDHLPVYIGFKKGR